MSRFPGSPHIPNHRRHYAQAFPDRYWPCFSSGCHRRGGTSSGLRRNRRPRDTLDPQDRAAAVLLLTRQFALAGEEVVADCPTPYLVAHVRLGNTITVTLRGQRAHGKARLWDSTTCRLFTARWSGRSKPAAR